MNLGLITEYNPFHNGHLLHLEKSRKKTNSTNIIVVMSGNFVQRGEPAILDKYTRTLFALKNGAHMVLELPIIYATSSAEFFAENAIKILDKSGIVDNICFGSESGSIKKLHKIACLLQNETEEYSKIIKENLKTGISYPVARSKTVNHFIKDSDLILNNPNNILGIEYLKALIKINSKIKPYTIKREISNYNSKITSGNISSATSIRNEILNNNFLNIKNMIPENIFHIFFEQYNNNQFVFYNNFSLILQYLLKNLSSLEISQFLDITEGLENRILNISNENFLISNIIKNVKTKRFTFTKIQRAIIHILLNIKTTDFNNFNNLDGPQYIRVLGFKKDKSFLLNDLIKNSSLPIVTNLKNAEKILNKNGMKMLDLEIKSTDIYYLGKNFNTNQSTEKNIEYKKPLIII